MRQPGNASPSPLTPPAVAGTAGASSSRGVTTPGRLNCGSSRPLAPDDDREPRIARSAAARVARRPTVVQSQPTTIAVGDPAAFDPAGEADPGLAVGPRGVRRVDLSRDVGG